VAKPSRIHIIAGGKFHDFDHARLVLLQIMAEDETIRATCASDFGDVYVLDGYDGVILYTCDMMPNEAESAAMAAFVAAGGRLFALHATNAPIIFTDGPAVVASGVNIPGLVEAPPPETAPAWMSLLGSRFQAHLAAQPMTINIADHDHELTRGLVDFEIVDEPYIATMIGKARVLMTARYKGEAPGYVLGHWDDDAPRPQLYVKEHGAGAVLYMTLGHACSRFDLQPMVDETATVRGPWDDETYREVLRRGIRWIGAPRAATAESGLR
jgi:type 1 glutamine amidotransferase